VLLTTHPLLVPWSWKSRAIPLSTLWATTGPVSLHNKQHTRHFMTRCHISTQYNDVILLNVLTEL